MTDTAHFTVETETGEVWDFAQGHRAVAKPDRSLEPAQVT